MHFKFLRFQYREFLLAKRVLAAGAGPPVRPAPPAHGRGSALFARRETLAAYFSRILFKIDKYHARLTFETRSYSQYL